MCSCCVAGLVRLQLNVKEFLVKILTNTPCHHENDAFFDEKMLIICIIITILLNVSQNFLCIEHKKIA